MTVRAYDRVISLEQQVQTLKRELDAAVELHRRLQNPKAQVRITCSVPITGSTKNNVTYVDVPLDSSFVSASSAVMNQALFQLIGGMQTGLDSLLALIGKIDQSVQNVVIDHACEMRRAAYSATGDSNV